jgi:hypothetical protein
MIGDFSEVAIFVLSKCAPVWAFELSLRFRNFRLSLDVWSWLEVPNLDLRCLIFFDWYCLIAEFLDDRYLRWASGRITPLENIEVMTISVKSPSCLVKAPLGSIEMIGDFSEVTIFVLSKCALVWAFELSLRFRNFRLNLDVWSWLEVPNLDLRLQKFFRKFCSSLIVESNFCQKICPSLDVEGCFLSNFCPDVYPSGCREPLLVHID